MPTPHRQATNWRSSPSTTFPPTSRGRWSRLDYSLTLRSLIDYSPQSVVFEMNLNDRDTEYASFDDTFSHVVSRANTVVFAATVLMTPRPGPLPTKLGSIPFKGTTHLVPRYGSAIWPLPTFAGESPVGVNNIESESDLRLRRLPLIFMLNGQMVPSLVLQAAARISRRRLAVVGGAGGPRHPASAQGRQAAADDPDRRPGADAHPVPPGADRLVAGELRQHPALRRPGPERAEGRPRHEATAQPAGLDRPDRSRRPRAFQDVGRDTEPRRGAVAGGADDPRAGLPAARCRR